MGCIVWAKKIYGLNCVRAEMCWLRKIYGLNCVLKKTIWAAIVMG
jgi:hypothetical protein